MIEPLCSGEGCPLKEECGHYTPEEIDKKKFDFFDKPPYKNYSKNCAFFPGREPKKKKMRFSDGPASGDIY